MDAAERGFLIVYEFEDDDRPLIIVDDGRVCYAHVRGPLGVSVCEAWLYNRVAAPDDADPRNLSWQAAPVNPQTYVHDWGDPPLPSSAADFRASLFKRANQPTTFYVFIRDELFAVLRAGEGLGLSRLAKKNGPLALRLPQPGTAYSQVIAPWWERVDVSCDADPFLRTFACVPEPAGHLLAIQWCESEVCNGGFHQFFMNSTGVLALEAARGMRAIGMPAMAEIVEQAMAVFGAAYPREQAQRRRVLEGNPPKDLDESKRDEWDPFVALDDAFYAAMRHDTLYDAADAYAARTMPAEARYLMSEPQIAGRVSYIRAAE
jgi:hypothetical protein